MAFDCPDFGNIHDTEYGDRLVDGAYPSDVFRQIEMYGNYQMSEEEVRNTFPELSGKTVVDVNANVGYWTLLLSKLVGPKGTVISLEPSQWAFAVLMRNIEANDRNNIVPKRCTLGNKDMKGKQPLYHNVYDLSKNALHPIKEGSDDDFEQVEVTTLDTLIAGQDDIYLINFNITDSEDSMCANAGALDIIDKQHITNFIRNGKIYKTVDGIKM